jgi:hypothetical protein
MSGKTARFRQIGEMPRGLPLRINPASAWPAFQPMEAWYEHESGEEKKLIEQAARGI